LKSSDVRPSSGSVGIKPIVARNSPATLRGWYLFNPNAVTVYLQFFDTSSDGDVTPGSTPPYFSLGIPAGSGANVVVGRLCDFLRGIVIVAATTRAGNVAPAVPLDFNIFFEPNYP
jgi:hypothetical protein